MEPLKTKKYTWKFNAPIEVDGELIESDITFGQDRVEALKALRNSYPRWILDVEPISVEDVVLYEPNLQVTKTAEHQVLDGGMENLLGEIEGSEEETTVDTIGGGYYD